jgi:hypothetical protein
MSGVRVRLLGTFNDKYILYNCNLDIGYRFMTFINLEYLRDSYTINRR